MKSNFNRPLRTRVIAISGWVTTACLILFIAPRAIKRGMHAIPSFQHEKWQETLNRKIDQISKNLWHDTRPLSVFAGDSQIELGNWYDLYSGRYAIRNCGLSSATIDDVTKIIQSIPNQNAERLVLLCGINDILRKRPIAPMVHSYQMLISKAVAMKSYREIVVISVLPINKSWPTPNTGEINLRVVEFNAHLSKICHEQNIHFLPLSSGFATPQGSLDINLTRDGLHLNNEGYHRMAKEIEQEVFGTARK